jgi:hypothetical protein
MNVYTVLGVKVPEVLHIAIKQKRAKAPITPPMDFITPQIDGRVTSYFEWQAAGVYQTEAGGTSTMRRAQNVIKTIYFGFDLQNLYFRFDLTRPLSDPSLESLIFKVAFINPEGYEVDLKLGKSDSEISMILRRKGASGNAEEVTLTSVAAKKIIEFKIPLDSFQSKISNFEWIVKVEKSSLEQEHWPIDNTISYTYPSELVFAGSWQI